jgi:tetratricopeptide (TPR) repeat protein
MIRTFSCPRVAKPNSHRKQEVEMQITRSWRLTVPSARQLNLDVISQKGKSMKKNILLTIICIFLIHGTLFANENFQHIDRFLDIAFQHARNYPPEFDSKIQKEDLEMELRKTIAQLESMIKNSDSDPEVLFRLGKANTFAFNLDIPGSKEKVDKYFKHLFSLEPNHAEGHLYYGQHLSGRGEFNSGIEHLKIAADAGWDIALNMIGLAYIQLDKTDEAKVYFQKFQRIHPDGPQIQMLLNALEPSSTYELKSMSE